MSEGRTKPSVWIIFGIWMVAYLFGYYAVAAAAYALNAPTDPWWAFVIVLLLKWTVGIKAGNDAEKWYVRRWHAKRA